METSLSELFEKQLIPRREQYISLDTEDTDDISRLLNRSLYSALPVVGGGFFSGLFSLERLNGTSWRKAILRGGPVVTEPEDLFKGKLDLSGLGEDSWPLLPVVDGSNRYRGFITPGEAELWMELGRYREAEYEFETIFEASHDGLHITDSRGYTLKLNQACEDLMEFTREDVVGRHLSEIVREGIIPDSAALTALNSGEIASRLHYGRNGKTVLLTATPIFRDGEIYRIVINNRDITELKEMEQKLSQAESRATKYRRELEDLRGISHGDSGLIYQSDVMRRLVEFVRHVAPVDSTILIQGESGVGKELFSRLIHRNSHRSSEAFMKIDCSAIPESLLESELFGYEKGAFTGAKKEGKPGLIEMANGGTLFLDEIGEMPLSLQVKLLRVLQDREIQRLGGGGVKTVDVRVITATNKDLEKMVRENRFREDLFYRLNVVPLKIPSLRERREDIEPLIFFFLDDFNRKYGMKKQIAPEAVEAMREYSWPGNVRELKNIVERIVVTSLGETVFFDDLPGDLRAGRGGCDEPLVVDGEGQSYQEAMEAFEQRFLLSVRNRCGSTAEMADLLGIDRSTVRRRLNRLSIPISFKK